MYIYPIYIHIIYTFVDDLYIYGYNNITLLWYDYILITIVIYPTTYNKL